jgi:hypothetical protein
MGLSFYWLNQPYTYENESTVISWFSILKNVALGIEDKPSKDDVLLINISYQKALLPKLDDYGFLLGNEAITDRKSLAAFFESAAELNQHKFIVCDVFLDKQSEDDSLLSATVKSVKNVLFPYHKENGSLVKPVVPVPSALSDYDSDFGNFVKYTFLQHDTCETIALKMHKKLDGISYQNGTPFDFSNGRPVLNSFIIDFPIRQFDIFREDTLGYNSMHLQNFMELPRDLQKETLKGKIVIIGDFLESDLHNTMYGATAGPLIHLNAYLNLRNERNILPFTFFIYLFAVYFAFSMVLFFPEYIVTFSWMKKLQNSKLGGFVFDYFKYAFFLLLMSLVSYLMFGIHLNVLIISLYISIMENLIEYIQQHLARKKEKSFEVC